MRLRSLLFTVATAGNWPTATAGIRYGDGVFNDRRGFSHVTVGSLSEPQTLGSIDIFASPGKNASCPVSCIYYERVHVLHDQAVMDEAHWVGGRNAGSVDANGWAIHEKGEQVGGVAPNSFLNKLYHKCWHRDANGNKCQGPDCRICQCQCAEWDTGVCVDSDGSTLADQCPSDCGQPSVNLTHGTWDSVNCYFGNDELPDHKCLASAKPEAECSHTCPETAPCPVDCAGSWSEPTACDVTCGSGTTTKTYTRTQDALHGGDDSCPVDGATETEPCDEGACRPPIKDISFGPSETLKSHHSVIVNWLNNNNCDEYQAINIRADWSNRGDPVTSETLKKIAEHCHNLRGILVTSSLAGDAGWVPLLEANPNLEYVYNYAQDGAFHHWTEQHGASPYPSDLTINAMIDNCPKLQVAQLIGCSASTSTLIKFIQNEPDLIRLSIAHWSNLEDTPELIATLTDPSYMRHLRFIHTLNSGPGGPPVISEDQVAEMLHTHPLMRFLYGKESQYGEGGSEYVGIKGDPKQSYYGRRGDCMRTTSGIGMHGLGGFYKAERWNVIGTPFHGKWDSRSLDCDMWCANSAEAEVWRAASGAPDFNSCDYGPQQRDLSLTIPRPVDCAGSWSEPTACDVTCGSGTTTKTYTRTQDALHGGDDSCPVDGATETEPCDEGACRPPIKDISFGPSETLKSHHSVIVNWLNNNNCDEYQAINIRADWSNRGDPVTSETLKKIAEHCHNLRGILVTSSLAGDAGWVPLLEANPNLEYVYNYAQDGAFHHWTEQHGASPYPSDLTINAMIDNCPKLQVAQLIGCSASTSTLIKFIQNEPDLIRLSIAHWSNLEDTPELIATLTDPSYMRHLRFIQTLNSGPGGPPVISEDQVAEMLHTHPLMRFLYGKESQYGEGGSEYVGIKGDPKQSYYGRRGDCMRTTSGIGMHGLGGFYKAERWNVIGTPFHGKWDSRSLDCDMWCANSAEAEVWRAASGAPDFNSCDYGPQQRDLSLTIP